MHHEIKHYKKAMAVFESANSARIPYSAWRLLLIELGMAGVEEAQGAVAA